MSTEECLAIVQEALREIAPATTQGEELAQRRLAELGISSVEMVSLVFAIEARLNIVFPDEELTAETFTSCETITRVATRLVAERGPTPNQNSL